MTPCILAFGLPRSGTSWVGKLFDSHPDTLYRHEPDSVRRLSIPLFPATEDASKYREELEQFVGMLPGCRAPKVVGKLPLFPKSYHSAAALLAYRSSVFAAKAASRAKRDAPCLYRPTAGGSKHARVVWKSIESSGRLGVLMQVLPDSRAIYLLRHPAGCVASRLRGEAQRRFDDMRPTADDMGIFKILLAMTTSKVHGLSLSDVEQFTPVERLAWRWVLTQERILADIASCDRVLAVRYEDICANPIAMTQRMFAFAGLDWHMQTEQFIRLSTRPSDTGYYSVYKNPTESAQRWQSELTPEAVERILDIFQKSSLYHFYGDGMRTPLEVLT